MAKKILVFKHMPSQNPGIFRELAEARDIEFYEIDLHAGDQIPDIENFDALWVMGGSMNVWQEREYPWLIDEKRTIRHAVEELRMPFFGICLGHQLLADALGGKVDKANDHEIGVFDVMPTAAGINHPLLSNLPVVMQWVNVHLVEVTRAPEQAIILAESRACKNHIMQIGRHAYSCEFHPEVCTYTVDEWMKIPGIPEVLEELIGTDGLQNFKRSIADNLPAHNAAATQLFDNWIGLVF